jgi:hypothetical protein
MKFIITRQNSDGTFDEVGMNNRYVTGGYMSQRTLIRYGIPMHWQLAGVRIEGYKRDSVLGEPDWVSYYTKLGPSS